MDVDVIMVVDVTDPDDIMVVDVIMDVDVKVLKVDFVTVAHTHQKWEVRRLIGVVRLTQHSLLTPV